MLQLHSSFSQMKQVVFKLLLLEEVAHYDFHFVIQPLIKALNVVFEAEASKFKNLCLAHPTELFLDPPIEFEVILHKR